MRRGLGILTLLAAGGLGFALLGGTDGTPAAQSAQTGGSAVDPVSFALGAIAGACAVWVRRLPWEGLAEWFAQSLRTWRRNAALMILAAAFAGVLLLY